MPSGGDGMMAGCERGYLCTVCGEDVEEITDSVRYLRDVLGEVAWDDLDRSPEAHIRCDPILAQFIVAEDFEPVSANGAFAKGALDPDFVRAEESRVTSGFLRLRAVAGTNLAIAQYPLLRAGAEANRGAGAQRS
jgi:hypothetical protein